METIKTILIITSFYFSNCVDHNSNYEFPKKTTDVSQSQILERENHMNKTSIQYAIKFNTNLSKIKAGEEVILSFSPKAKDEEDIAVELETVHEKKAHIIIVSDDLEYFSHIHPEYEGNGNYSIKTNFPFGGKYELFIEYKPKGSEKIIDHFNLLADGNEKPEAKFRSVKYFYRDQNLLVNLKQTEDIFPGSENSIPVEIIKDGKEINAANLDNYLGEKAHAVVIGISDFEFLMFTRWLWTTNFCYI